MIKIAKDGWPYIIVSTAIMTATYLLNPWFAFPFLVLTLFFLYFFRDPDRETPGRKGIFVAPADGKIITVSEKEVGRYGVEQAKQISIFMSPFNVHINRAPCDGVVEDVEHSPGGFKAAYTDEASLSNEQLTMVLSTDYGRVIVKQIAGFLARRAVCKVSPGERVAIGQRYGLIKFGSRVDLLLPVDVEVKVKIGDKVRAGESIVAILSHEGAGKNGFDK